MAIKSVKNKTRSGSLLMGNAPFIPTSFESIATATGTGSSGTITFSSIPSTYTHLQLRFSALASSSSVVNLTLNNVTSSSYWWHEVLGNGSGAFADNSSATNIRVSNGGTDASFPLVGIIDIHNYTNTTQNKTVRMITGIDKNGSGRVDLRSGLLTSTSAINRLDIIADTFSTGATFSLYGIK